MAALMAKKDGKTTVSSVGGIPVPAVVRYIAGFQAGEGGLSRASRRSTGTRRTSSPRTSARTSPRTRSPRALRRVPGRRRLRPRRARRGQGEGRLGHRRRRRPGLREQPRAHERAEEGRRRRLHGDLRPEERRQVRRRHEPPVQRGQRRALGLGTINKGVPAGIKAQAMATAKKVAAGTVKPAREVLAEP